MSHDNSRISRGSYDLDYEEVLQRLQEAEDTIEAIRSGGVDAVVVAGPNGHQVFTLQGADQPYRVMVETMREGAVTISLDGAVLYGNQAFSDMIGIPLSHFVGSSFRTYIIPKNRHAFTHLIEQGLDGKPRKFETYLRAASGKYIPVLIAISRLMENEGTTALCMVVTDLSDLAAAQEAQRSNRDLEQFAYVASHDLQEPLRSISIHMQLLRRRLRDKLDPDSDELISSAVTGAVRMSEMINDLLAYARINSQSAIPRPVDMNLVVRNVIENMHGTIRHLDVCVDIMENLPTIQGDQTQLTQLFQNLLGNAIKFRTDRPLEIYVGARDEDREWVFRVSDNGIGIDPKYHDKIFTIFQRLHTHDTYQGTGIGLSICKRIIERHGGRIWVESQTGEGTSFFFSFLKA